MSKVYITSKSKTFKEGANTLSIAAWVSRNIEYQLAIGNHWKSKKKYKITITNLKLKYFT